MAEGRWWIALVTFERLQEGENAILPDWALGACGWMMALAPSEDEAKARLLHDVEHHELRVIEIENEREVFGEQEIVELDNHLAANFVAVEPASRLSGALSTATKAKVGHKSLMSAFHQQRKPDPTPPV